jgi:hypothetical protein
VIVVADRFSGKLTLPEQDVVAVDLEISPDALTLRADSVLIGTWPIKYCRVSKLDASTYRISVDGEVVSFEPDDARQFAIVAAQRFKASSLADRINVVRSVDTVEDLDPVVESERQKAPPVDLSVLRSPLLGVVVAVIVLVFAGTWLVRAVFADEPVTAPPVTFDGPSTSAENPAVSAFDVEPSLLVVEWNRVATQFGANLLIRDALPRGSFDTQLAPLISLQGTTDDQGDVRSLVVVADPSGDPDSDQLTIVAWGIALTVADPSLGEADRREVLAEMGLNVRSPELGGLDGETSRNGIRYTMKYFQSFSSVLLTIAPEG